MTPTFVSEMYNFGKTDEKEFIQKGNLKLLSKRNYDHPSHRIREKENV